MPSLWTEIDKSIADHPEASAKTIATSLVRRLKRDALIALLTDEIEHRMRARSREIEIRAFRSRFTGETLAETVFGPDFKAVLAEPVKIGDGTRGLTFGDMTTEQHQQRIAMLTKIRDGIDATVSRHLEAIGMIEEAGVNCLNDLQSNAA